MAVRRGRILLAAATLSIITISGQSTARELHLGALLAPVIALEAHVPEQARSAQSLGTVRGGTGVLIDGAGLVLTIGYLILEADAVELLPDGLRGERVPADVVAWDPITGLGLVRSKKALGIAPMALGDSATLKTEDAVITASWTREAGMLPAFIVDRGPYAGYWEYLLEDAL